MPQYHTVLKKARKLNGPLKKACWFSNNIHVLVVYEKLVWFQGEAGRVMKRANCSKSVKCTAICDRPETLSYNVCLTQNLFHITFNYLRPSIQQSISAIIIFQGFSVIAWYNRPRSKLLIASLQSSPYTTHTRISQLGNLIRRQIKGCLPFSCPFQFSRSLDAQRKVIHLPSGSSVYETKWVLPSVRKAMPFPHSKYLFQYIVPTMSDWLLVLVEKVVLSITHTLSKLNALSHG